jgi:uncharacterized protein YuzB (UPF0349 family)
MITKGETPMGMLIKFCPCNFEDELERVKNEIRQLSNVEVVDERCLNYCGQCLVQPYALVDGENVIADDPEELLPVILKKIGFS